MLYELNSVYRLDVEIGQSVNTSWSHPLCTTRSHTPASRWGWSPLYCACLCWATSLALSRSLVSCPTLLTLSNNNTIALTLQ